MNFYLYDFKYLFGKFKRDITPNSALFTLSSIHSCTLHYGRDHLLLTHNRVGGGDCHITLEDHLQPAHLSLNNQQDGRAERVFMDTHSLC